MSEDDPITTDKHELYGLNDEQRGALLRIAREAIERTVTKTSGNMDDVSDPGLLQPAAVFVTLWKKIGESQAAEEGSLRGCIGRLQPDYPLYLAVRSAAISAATRDPRFVPVRPEELDDLIIEIALLSPLEDVKDLREITIGHDGLVIESQGRRGLLLPKVATRMGWDRVEFLHNVCLKAGLPPDTWPASGTLQRFSTFVFQE